MRGLFLIGACVVAATASAQSTLEYWVQKLDVNLTGYASGVPSTNGVVAGVKPTAMTLSSKELIQMLNNKTVFAISKGFTNFTVLVTNRQPGPDVVVTNTVSYAVPLFRQTVGSFSSSSKLLLFEPLVNTNLSSMVVVRDSLTDYDVSRYFQFAPSNFDARTNGVVTQGRFDIAHDLVSATEFSNQRFAFDDTGFTTAPPTGTHLEVQGFWQDKQFSLIENGKVLGNKVRRLATMSAAGTGQVGGTNGFVVLHGNIRISGGRREVN